MENNDKLNFLTGIQCIIVHNGTYHLDDVLCIALIQLCSYRGVEIFRTNNPSSLHTSKLTITCDVGGGVFDHHQSDASTRPDGTKYSAFGLLWREFGRTIIQNGLVGLNPQTDNEIVEEAFKLFDEEFVIKVDRTDNYGQAKFPNDLANVISVMSSTNYKIEIAVSWAKMMIIPLIEKSIGDVKARKEAKNLATNPCILLDHYIPARLFEGTVTQFTVSKSNREGWNLTAVSPATIDLPKEEMAGCTFIHPAKFLAVFNSKEDAVNAANQLLNK